jgi:MFS family permease
MKARTSMCLLLAGCRFFQQNMRNTLANVVVQMGVTPTEKGALLSKIALGYLLTQVPGGALANWMGTKNVITCTMLLSALCCLILPTAFDSFGMDGLGFVLFLMGCVQGPLFPVSSVFLAAWCPKSRPGEPDEKAWATSMLDVGISLGTLFNGPIIISVAESFGWQTAYHATGVGSALFVVVWWLLAAESPSNCWYISAEEKSFLAANAPKLTKPKATAAGEKVATDRFASIVGMPWAVAVHSGVWAVFVAHMAFNFGACNAARGSNACGIPARSS